MPEKGKLQVPEVGDPTTDVAAAAQQALEQVKKGVMPRVTEDDLVWNDPETEVIKGKQYHSDAWIHGPANVELLSSAYKMLLKMTTTPVNQVEKVRVARVRDTKYIIIKPTSASDPNGIEVKTYNSSAWINAVTVLGPAKLNVRSGYRDRFVVEAAPDDFPGAPALLINLGKRVERVLEAKKTASGTTGAEAKATKGTKPPQAAAKPAEPTAPAPATPDEAK